MIRTKIKKIIIFLIVVSNYLMAFTSITSITYIVGIQGNNNFEFKYLGLQMACTWPLLTFFSSELKYFQWLTVVQPKEHLYFTYTKVV